MKLPFIFFLSIATLFYTGCSQSKKEAPQTAQATDLQVVELLGDKGELRLPKGYKRTSRYRIEEDMPELAQDSIRLLLMQNRLAAMEFDDAEIDVFYDTLSRFHHLSITDLEFMPFDRTIAAALNQELKKMPLN